MSQVAVGTRVPDFTATATGNTPWTLAAHKGRALVVYFYPKANTPGCTNESVDFRDHYEAFQDAGAEVVGVSRDGLKAQDNFKNTYQLPFPLLADTDETVCRLFAVIKEKNMYGKKVMGIERSTFLIDAEGVLRKEWRKVKVPGHAAEVLDEARAL